MTSRDGRGSCVCHHKRAAAERNNQLVGEGLNVHSAGHDNYVAPRIVSHRERLRAMRQLPKHDQDDNGLAARGAAWTGGDYRGEYDTLWRGR